jgi:hypothetical protein
MQSGGGLWSLQCAPQARRRQPETSRFENGHEAELAPRSRRSAHARRTAGTRRRGEQRPEAATQRERRRLGTTCNWSDSLAVACFRPDSPHEPPVDARAHLRGSPCRAPLRPHGLCDAPGESRRVVRCLGDRGRPTAAWEAKAAEDGLERGAAYWDSGWAWIVDQRTRRVRP